MKPVEILNLVLGRLERMGVPYMVGGSFASSFYGKPRSTYDADLIVDLKHEHLKEFLETFQADFYVDRQQAEQAIQAKRSFNLIHIESSFKVDIFILGIRKFDREEFSRRRRQQLTAEPPVETFLKSPEDILLSKLECYRLGGETSTTQWQDVLGILKTQAGQLDFAYLRKWAEDLGVTALLERASREAGLSLSQR
jgi:hypothetical protein